MLEQTPLPFYRESGALAVGNTAEADWVKHPGLTEQGYEFQFGTWGGGGAAELQGNVSLGVVWTKIVDLVAGANAQGAIPSQYNRFRVATSNKGTGDVGTLMITGKRPA